MFLETGIIDCFLIHPKRMNDDRGFFQETFEEKKYGSLSNIRWAQSNWSRSKKNVLRGIHCAKYAKLVNCVRGRIWDVVVDLRSKSPTYKKVFSIEISEENALQVYVPEGCGHGFLSLEDNSSLFYLQTGLFALYGEETYRYDSFGIDWPCFGKYILSSRDQEAEPFSD